MKTLSARQNNPLVVSGAANAALESHNSNWPSAGWIAPGKMMIVPSVMQPALGQFGGCAIPRLRWRLLIHQGIVLRVLIGVFHNWFLRVEVALGRISPQGKVRTEVFGMCAGWRVK